MKPAMKCLPIVGLLNGLNTHHGKNYCFPSQLKIMELLENRMSISISIATLNRWLRVIEDAGYVKRTRRIRRDKKHGMMFKSTLYKITRRGYRLLASFGMEVWERLRKPYGHMKKTVSRPSTKKPGVSPGADGYFLPGSGLLEDVSKKPT